MVPEPKLLNKFWVRISIYLFLMGMEFPIIGKPPRANPTAHGKMLQAHSLFSSPVCMLPKKVQAMLSWDLLSLYSCSSLFLCVPPKNANPFPSNQQPLFVKISLSGVVMMKG